MKELRNDVVVRAELQKLEHDVPVIAVHIKTAYDEQVRSELQSMNLP